jgi:hypothetical protein
MDSSFSPKDEIWFLRVCHHISNAAYLPTCSAEGSCRAMMVGKQVHVVLLCCARRDLLTAVRWSVNFVACMLAKCYIHGSGQQCCRAQTVTNYILVNLVIISNTRFHSKPGNHSCSVLSVLPWGLRLRNSSGVPMNFFRGGSTNSVEDRGQRTGIWGR